MYVYVLRILHTVTSEFAAISSAPASHLSDAVRASPVEDRQLQTKRGHGRAEPRRAGYSAAQIAGEKVLKAAG